MGLSLRQSAKMVRQPIQPFGAVKVRDDASQISIRGLTLSGRLGLPSWPWRPGHCQVGWEVRSYARAAREHVARSSAKCCVGFGVAATPRCSFVNEHVVMSGDVTDAAESCTLISRACRSWK